MPEPTPAPDDDPPRTALVRFNGTTDSPLRRALTNHLLRRSPARLALAPPPAPPDPVTPTSTDQENPTP